MAARLNPKQDERTRSVIQTTQLCKRLNYFALGIPDPASKAVPLMTDGQIRAALGLLKKTLPDISEETHKHTGSVSLTVVTAVDNDHG